MERGVPCNGSTGPPPAPANKDDPLPDLPPVQGAFKLDRALSLFPKATERLCSISKRCCQLSFCAFPWHALELNVAVTFLQDSAVL